MAIATTACGKNNNNFIAANINVLSEISLSIVAGEGVASGAMTKADDGSFIIASGSRDTMGRIFIFKSDSFGSVVSDVINFYPRPASPHTMINVNGRIILNIETENHQSGSEYHSEILISDDNGDSFNQVKTDENYVYMFSSVFDSSGRVAVSLWHIPQSGYKNSIVDFGWFDPVTFETEVMSRLATVGDEPHNFPSEVFFYRRPSDQAIVAAVRWGEAPEIPFLKLKVSQDGSAWADQGSVLYGYAGKASVCINAKGEMWGLSYLKTVNYVAHTVMWRLNPETGVIQETRYPYSQYGNEDVGNGQIYCDSSSDNLFIAVNNNGLTFSIVER